MTPQTTLTRDLVLVGGGHTHALFLRMWGMKPMHGVQVTLITPSPTAPYSGMLPGYVAGHYSREDLDIDLIKLARFAGARVVFGAAEALDPERKVIAVSGRGVIHYDFASVDVGLHGLVPDLPGFSEHAVGAKPLDTYAEAWAAYLRSVSQGNMDGMVAVIGGGIAGCELALAMAHRLREMGKAGGVTVLEAAPRLAEATPGADAALQRAMKALDVQVIAGAQVQSITNEGVELADGRQVSARFVVGAAGGFAHGWLASTGLPCDAQGFVRVDETLRVEGQADLFAVGDCASMIDSPRPKAGVFAVRAAPVLYHNMRAALTDRPLRPFRPQKDYLKLMSLGGQRALAAKWGQVISTPGVALWRWKDRIDQAFMRKFSEFPAMTEPRLLGDAVAGAVDDHVMCGGCGSKVAPGQLAEVLAAMPKVGRSDVIRGAGDDAAVLQVSDQRQVISVDHLRAFVPDHGLMARITTVHALGDVWSMGAEPQSALASVTLPRMSPTLQARAMEEIMTAIGDVLRGIGAEVVGGHSSMGAELTIGLTVTGLLDGAEIGQDGAQAGDALILTRPIGSGTLLAAEMQGKARGHDVARLYQVMATPQGEAAGILGAAHAMTDVTGFGLAGHLMAMCRASDVAAEIDLSAVPVYPGAEALAAAGHRSTIYEDNKAAAPVFGPASARAALLHDPQTAGGFLAAVPAGNAAGLVDQLRVAGHEAAVIGHLTEGPASITLR